jgi:SAM-dependent methyltransferase
VTDNLMQKCPLCNGHLVPRDRTYKTVELFALWKDADFSPETVSNHRGQSETTREYRCRRCQFSIYLPQVIGSPSFYADLQNSEADTDYYISHKWDFEVGVRSIKQGERVLDYGCGPGYFLSLARLRTHDLWGIESNPASVIECREQGFRVYQPGDAPQSLKCSVDRLFCFHVLEHVADPVAFLQELSAFVKPGGTMNVSVPDMDGPIKYIRPCVMNMPPHHATKWGKRALTQLGKRAGLIVSRFQHEPLIQRDSYYYSTYWVEYLCQRLHLSGKLLRLVRGFLRRFLTRWLRRVFKQLDRRGRKYLRLLRGQSVLVTYQKKIEASIR